MKNSISYLNGIVDHIAAIEDRPGELGQLLSYERMELVQEQVSMIQTLLLLALKNAKGDANKVTALQVRKKTNEALSLFSISTLGKGKTVELTMPAEEFCVHISSIDWQTMLINLLNNAADAADQYLVERTTDISPDNLIELVELQEKSMITLNVSQQRDRVYIEISNIGTPIPIDILPTIFEQGYTTKDVGNGVGLYDVRQILKQARGDISVYNREDGVTFELYLPIVDCE
ncbi:MAG: GHKL domain-containing protein [Gammaproteobacteria bacterium]|nr:GHKL domain-containing protein [Gammaproteobacteria bacterium]